MPSNLAIVYDSLRIFTNYTKLTTLHIQFGQCESIKNNYLLTVREMIGYNSA